MKKKTKKIDKLIETIKKSPISFFSDLFICSMVAMWIVDNIYEALIATVVTFSSIVLSFMTGTHSYEISMWANIGTNVAMPLSVGGALWMIKNAISHYQYNKNGTECPMDFPDDLGIN